MAYTFDNLLAIDPNDPDVVAADASITIYATGDATKTPVTLTDLTGTPVPNPVTVNNLGFGPKLQHPTIDHLTWEGGGMSGTLISYEGMKDEAVAARLAAETAGTTAASAAEADLAARIAAGEFEGAAGPLTNLSIGTVEATPGNPLTDSIIASEISSGTDTVAALKTTYGRNGAQIARKVAEKLSGVKVVVIIRHDDGQLPQMNYLPIYDAHNAKASFVIVPTYIDMPGKFSLAQLKQVFDAGHDIGSHTMTHPQANAYDLTETERRYELSASKAWLETTLGNGYVCEHITYPGNQPVYTNELFEYYLAGFGDGAAAKLTGPIDLAAHSGSLGTDWFDNASSTANKAKINARIATLKAQGSAVDVVQVHNYSEGTPTQLDELLTIIDADPEVITLTLTEWMHYVRETFETVNGRHYAKGINHNGGARTWKSAALNSGAYIADRLNLGKAFRALVNGVEVATLDTELSLLGPGTSTLEKGHKLAQYSSDNSRSFTQSINTLGLVHLVGTGLTYLLTDGFGIRARRDGTAIEAQSATGEDRFAVDTTRGVMWLPNLTALPSGYARPGELCIVNGVLKMTVADNQWVTVGTQT